MNIVEYLQQLGLVTAVVFCFWRGALNMVSHMGVMRDPTWRAYRKALPGWASSEMMRMATSPERVAELRSALWAAIWLVVLVWLFASLAVLSAQDASQLASSPSAFAVMATIGGVAMLVLFHGSARRDRDELVQGHSMMLRRDVLTLVAGLVFYAAACVEAALAANPLTVCLHQQLISALGSRLVAWSGLVIGGAIILRQLPAAVAPLIR